MPDDLPTGSVTGRQEWKWNKWQTDRDSPADSPGATDRRDRGPSGPGADRGTGESGLRSRPDGQSGPRELRLRRLVEELEARLERKERRIQYIIEHYERLLSEKNRELAARSSAESGSGIPVLSRVCQYVSGR